jgi:hypothetical protein
MVLVNISFQVQSQVNYQMLSIVSLIVALIEVEETYLSNNSTIVISNSVRLLSSIVCYSTIRTKPSSYSFL